MSSYKVDAIVIRSREFKESDRLVTLYSREHGKISAVAKGARKSTSKQRGGVQLYTYADFMLYKGKSLDTIQQAHPRETFLYLWNDYERSLSAGCMAEALNAATPDGEADGKVFMLSLRFLFILEMLDPWVALAAYGLRLMAHQGYLPDDAEQVERTLMSVVTPASGAVPVSEGAKNIIGHLCRKPWDQMGRLRLSASQRREICQALRVFCENKLEQRLIAWKSFEETG
jgi:DNA repair protein RecO (recombination protein O)